MVGQKRRGYTLLEIVLVLAIIAITGALAVPMLENMLAGDKLVSAADMVKSRLSEMQSRAREEGRAYKFTFTESGDSFRIEPCQDCAGGTMDSAPIEDKLPTNITFKGATASSTDGEGDSSPTFEIVVLPDGTSPQNFEITLAPTEGRAVVVRVRGLTGAVSSGPDGEGGR